MLLFVSAGVGRFGREVDMTEILVTRRGGGDSTVTSNDLIVSVQFNVAGEVKDVSSIW